MNPSSYLADVCNSLGHNLHRIGQLTREETNKVLKPYDLTPEQWQMLAVLYKTNGVTPTELGEITLRDKTTISRILPGLFKKGFIYKEAHPQDSRSYVVKLVDQYQSMVEESLMKIREHYQTSFFAPLSKDEQQQLLHLLVKLRKGVGDL
ncbi:MarR family winged helix-turn-helix transcriptional regulator [Brevibacillus laterosporus]|uniref:MarR family winged helix-turn-helix transcriptional regulator n=1 Tax=Brevibacillus laterosporus TaxID=1465 RepID=UPI00264D7BEE|nr:MarR family transcriptional regulator [Brevibacillus laterosporus]MDN9010349.1 MarR family transcriptional regulator [Brevibacillus laterosporus]MDO0941236.1 MarR family transcriptional regulator [Brevibacillus laterosporus]